MERRGAGTKRAGMVGEGGGEAGRMRMRHIVVDNRQNNSFNVGAFEQCVRWPPCTVRWVASGALFA